MHACLRVPRVPCVPGPGRPGRIGRISRYQSGTAKASADSAHPSQFLMLFFPPPPWQVSVLRPAVHGIVTTAGGRSETPLPVPPATVLLPLPAVTVSLPAPASILSLPAPVMIVSLPPLPSIVSLPSRPTMKSSPAVPPSLSLLEVPAIIVTPSVLTGAVTAADRQRYPRPGRTRYGCAAARSRIHGA